MTVVACSEQSELIISLWLVRIYHEAEYKSYVKPLFGLCSALRNVRAAVVNIRSAVVNVQSAVRNID